MDCKSQTETHELELSALTIISVSASLALFASLYSLDYTSMTLHVSLHSVLDISSALKVSIQGIL